NVFDIRISSRCPKVRGEIPTRFPVPVSIGGVNFEVRHQRAGMLQSTSRLLVPSEGGCVFCVEARYADQKRRIVAQTSCLWGWWASCPPSLLQAGRLLAPQAGSLCPGAACPLLPQSAQ